jgi:hypothetical protein
MPPLTWLAALALLQPVAAATPGELAVVLALEDQANEIWSDLPETADDARVIRLGGTSTACAREALRSAQAGLERGQAGRIALRTLALTVPVPRALLGRRPTGEYSRDAVVAAVYGSLRDTRSDHALQPVLGLTCPGAALHEIRALPERPGRLYLHMAYEGGCVCAPRSPEERPRRFRVLGQAELEPGQMGSDARGVTLRWRIRTPRYTVMAACGACEPREREQPRAGACAAPCAPLARAASGWAEEAAALERGGAGTAGARERLAELRRAAQEASAAEQRCEAQCQARGQASPETSVAASNRGGGIPAAAVVLGASAVAAGAVVAAKGSSEPEPPPPPPVFEGTWSGTSFITIVFQGTQCVRGYSESWTVRRSGASFSVDIARNETCGNTTCGGCMSRAFPPLNVTGGSATGDRFTFPSWYDVFFGPHPCPINGRLEGTRLSASSGPCPVLTVAEGTVFHTYAITLDRR